MDDVFFLLGLYFALDLDSRKQQEDLGKMSQEIWWQEGLKCIFLPLRLTVLKVTGGENR